MTLLTRTLHAAFLTAVANHPEVRPWLGHEGPLDLSALIEDPANVTLVTALGGFVFAQLAPGLYEGHSLFLPDHGTTAIRAMREALRYLFVETDALDIVTKVPASNRRAIGFARLGGFCTRFTRTAVWQGADGTTCDVRFCGLTLERWMLQAPETLAAGDAFHTLLQDAKRAAGSTLPVHDDDPVHDAMAGGAMLLSLAGNVGKAIVTYNRWARFAGYSDATLVSLQPAVIDVGDAIVSVQDGQLVVLRVR